MQGMDLHDVAAARLHGIVPPWRSLPEPRFMGTSGISLWSQRSRSDQPLSLWGVPERLTLGCLRSTGTGSEYDADHRRSRNGLENKISSISRYDALPWATTKSGRGFLRAVSLT